MAEFLALGNCTLDDVVTAEGQIATAQIGGNGVYAAVGMRLWGVAVALVSVIGRDFPQPWLEALAQANIDVSATRRLDIPHGLRSRAFYLPNGRRTDRVSEAQAILPPDAGERMDLVTEYTETGSPLHRRLWPLFSPLPPQLIEVASGARYAHLAPGALANNRQNAAFLKERAIVTTLDWPWWDWDQEGTPDQAVLSHIDYLLPSIEELSIYAAARGQDPFVAARDLLALGPQSIVVKMGVRGLRVLASPQAEWIEVPVYPTSVVDPTGAGDAFCGGFLVGLAQTGDPVQAALYGTVSASFIIEAFGLLHGLEVSADDACSRLDYLQKRGDHNSR